VRKRVSPNIMMYLDLNKWARHDEDYFNMINN